MRVSLAVLAAMVVCLAFVQPAMAAERFARVEVVAQGNLLVPEAEFGKLRTYYFAGRYADLRAALKQLVAHDGAGKTHNFDLVHNHYSFAFIAANPLNNGEATLVRVFTYADGYARSNAQGGAVDVEFADAVLPGINTFYDVFLTTDLNATVGTTCSYVEVESPLYADFLKLAKQIAIGQIAEYVSGQGLAGPDRAKFENVYFRVAQVTVPVRRANITLKSMVDAEGSKLENTTTYTNAPLRRISFGAVVGGMFGQGRDERVKISNDRIAADPLSGTMSIAAVYIHPVKFVAERTEPSFGERLRLLAGYIATPQPGIALGAGLLLFRGLTVNAGYGLMPVNALRTGSHVGDAVVSEKPFRRGYAGSVFFGFGYNVQ